MYQHPCVHLVCSYSPLKDFTRNRLEFLFSLQIIANASFKFGQVLNKSILDLLWL